MSLESPASDRAMDQLIAKSAARAAAGVMPPKWVYAKVISDIEATLASNGDMMLSGNAILDDFRAKLAKLGLPSAEKDRLAAAAVKAWKESAAPAYGRLRREMQRQERLAGNDDGVWRLPNGAAYYNQLLRTYTTTELTADQIHALGLQRDRANSKRNARRHETARLHSGTSPNSSLSPAPTRVSFTPAARPIWPIPRRGSMR